MFAVKRRKDREKKSKIMLAYISVDNHLIFKTRINVLRLLFKPTKVNNDNEGQRQTHLTLIRKSSKNY